MMGSKNSLALYLPLTGGTLTGATIISVADGVQGLLIAGASKGVRFIPSSSGVAIAGVDQTGGASYQPLIWDASAHTFRLSGVTKGDLGGTTANAWTFSAPVTVAGALAQTSGATFPLGNAGGTADALTFTPSPAITAYTTGAFYIGKATAANATTTPTANISGLGAKTIVKNAATALVANDMVNGKPCLFWYDGTNMILLNPAAL